MNNQEVVKLKKWCEKFFQNNSIGFDKFDFSNEIDIKLNFEENKTILSDKLKLFFNKYSAENVINLSKKEVSEDKVKVEYQMQQLNRGIEEQAQLEFQNSLSKIITEKESILLEQKFWLMQQFVKMVCEKKSNGLIVEGSAGLGKSYNILKVLNESKVEFEYCSGFTTTLELFNFLYQNRNKIIFFDDTKSIFKNPASLELLKASLFSPTNKRIVRYLSTTTKLKAPSQFLFEGGIIVALNDIGNFSEDLKAVVDRVSYYPIKFSYQEKLLILADLVKQEYKGLTKEDRQYIYEWIKENTTEATINLNFRLLNKLYDIFLYDKANFCRIAKGIIRTDEQQELIISLLKRNSTIRGAEQEWCGITGMHRATFYRIKKELVA